MIKLTEKQNNEIVKYIRNQSEVIALYLFDSIGNGANFYLNDHESVFAALTYDDKEINLEKERALIDDINNIIKCKNFDFFSLLKAPLTLQMDVVKKGELLFCRDKILLADYKEQLIRRYCDFEPDLNEFLRDCDVGLREDSNG